MSYTTKQFIVEIIAFMMIMGIGLGIYTMGFNQTYDYGTAVITIIACCVSTAIAENV
jgi:hypothetical protein